VLPRECDNDDCDYEAYIDDLGRPRIKWVHAEDCTPAWGPDASDAYGY
jgi:hypothetical protein